MCKTATWNFKKEKIEGLIRRGAWEVVMNEYIPAGANMSNGRFFVTIKNMETDTLIYKARVVLQGHKDMEQTQPVQNSTTVRRSLTRLLIAWAAIFGLRVGTHDIKQA